jgi:hypothetical protein
LRKLAQAAEVASWRPIKEWSFDMGEGSIAAYSGSDRNKTDGRSERQVAVQPPQERFRIPLELGSSPSEWLAARGLRIIGGDRFGTLFVAHLPESEDIDESP